MITAYSHAIQTTWQSTVLPKPTRINIEAFRELVGKAESAAQAWDQGFFLPILQEINRHVALTDTLSVDAIARIGELVESLPKLGRRAGDGGVRDRGRMSVLLVDGHGESAQNLCLALAQMSIEVRVARDLSANDGPAPYVQPVNLVVVGDGILSTEADLDELVALLGAMTRDSGTQVGVVLTADRSLTFDQRLVATRLGPVRIFKREDEPRAIRDLLVNLASEAHLDGARVLLIDDSPTDAYKASVFLKEAGLLVEHVSDPSKALDSIAMFDPDLVVMDYHMPICNGDAMAALIRQDPELTMPIIFLSSESDSEKQLMAISRGADGFVNKPLQQGAFINAIKSMICRAKAIDRRMRRDPLTSLLNHAQIMETAKRLVADGKAGSIALIDIDHFKSVNDTYGHPVGDRVLIKLADVLSSALRDSDSVGRVGGEEFVIVLPGASPENAKLVLDRIRNCFMSVQHVAETGSSFACTFSGGVTALDYGVSIAMRQADDALYKAKHAGRNLVVIARPDS